MTPEGKLTKAVKDLLYNWKQAGVPLWYFKVWGNVMQRAGIPDIVACVCGRFVAIELKAGRNKPTKLQELTMKLIRQAGGIAAPCWSVEEVTALLAPILKEHYE